MMFLEINIPDIDIRLIRLDQVTNISMCVWPHQYYILTVPVKPVVGFKSKDRLFFKLKKFRL